MECKECGEKDEDKFYSSNKSKCKVCVRNSVNKRRQDKHEEIKHYDRNRPNHKQRVQDNKERLARIKVEDPEKYRMYQDSKKAWGKRNKHKRNTHLRLMRAVYNGTVKKLDHCEHCDSKDNIHGHHPDYSKPLEVIWLCTSCHGIEHKKINQEVRDAK